MSRFAPLVAREVKKWEDTTWHVVLNGEFVCMRISMVVMMVSLSHCASVNGVRGIKRWRSSWVIVLR